MNPDHGLFSEVYKLDEATNHYMIEIALDSYADIFDEWDPAPFKRRSLDPDLQLYLEGSSEEIPLRYPIELYFTLPKGSQNSRLEEETSNGIRNSCLFKIYLLKREIVKTNALIFRYLVLGFLLLWLGTVFVKQNESATFLVLFADALLIGGWVFIWEAISLFFFTNRELYHSCQIYRRLKNAPLIFREVESYP